MIFVEQNFIPILPVGGLVTPTSTGPVYSVQTIKIPDETYINFVSYTPDTGNISSLSNIAISYEFIKMDTDNPYIPSGNVSYTVQTIKIPDETYINFVSYTPDTGNISNSSTILVNGIRINSSTSSETPSVQYWSD